VWLTLAKWYLNTIEPRPLWPGKPLIMHTARELEDLVLRWKSGQVCWVVNNSVEGLPDQRRFGGPLNKWNNCAYLVPGGRWLLVTVGTFCGSVQYYDLDSPTTTAFTLVPTLFEEDSFSNLCMSIDIQSDAECLTFHLGLLASRRRDYRDPLFPYGPPSRYAHWIQVWRVTSDLDKSGKVRGLTAEQLTCFREEHKGSDVLFCLQESHVAYKVYYTASEAGIGNDSSRIAIVDWTQCDSNSMAYNRRIIPSVSADVSIFFTRAFQC
jgi:hypothetical protein